MKNYLRFSHTLWMFKRSSRSVFFRLQDTTRTVVFRKSHLWNPQYGVEDQGWLSWFTIAGMLEKITVYGNGTSKRCSLY